MALEAQPVGAISESGGFGSYDMRPRRLVELGYATALRSERSEGGRQIYKCEFVLPWTEARFLGDVMAQDKVLVRSIILYRQEITDGKVKKPEEMSMAGALAILHRGGRGALASWPELFSDTRVLYEAARGAF